MEGTRFIQVILPLRLEWNPYYSLPEGLSPAVGDRVRVNFSGRGYVGVVSALALTPPEELSERILPIEACCEDLPPVSAQEMRFWQELADYYLCTVGEVYKAAYPSVQSHLPKRKKLPAAPAPVTVPDISLTAAQQTALDGIRKAFLAGKTALLNGVTGSGKTEIYMQLAAETLQEGRSVLYLVPEIALSRQLEARVARRFPGVLLYHSGETPARRRRVAEALRSDTPSLVLGTRSALFLPHRNLGLVVVDEEHDTSYKQDAPAPRYHAREAAILLARIQGARVLLGSATPSLESLYNAEKGIFTRIDLKERFYTGSQAEIQLIDTEAERRKGGMVGSFSKKLLALIQATLDRGEQVLLLRSRRSYSPVLQCTGCGYVPRCTHCHVPLSLHRSPDRLLCHYCGHTEAFPGTCPRCGAPLQPLGAGTQRIEEELQELFPTVRIGRLDGDSAAAEEDIVGSFARGETDILVGTQMITKGFDFEKLTLVGVLQADTLLAQESFRADERCLQLLEQFRGRCGRRGTPGTFVIQTREPGHPVFGRLKGQSDNTPQLLEERRLFGYPPFTRLIHLQIKDSNLQRAEQKAQALVRQLEGVPGLSGHVVGPYAPLVDKVADHYIRQIRVMLPRDKYLKDNKERLLQSIAGFERQRDYTGHIVVDVDPL